MNAESKLETLIHKRNYAMVILSRTLFQLSRGSATKAEADTAQHDLDVILNNIDVTLNKITKDLKEKSNDK